MRQLQSQVEQNHAINFGDRDDKDVPDRPTKDRAPLKTLGEGRLVRIEKAYVLISRREGPESVNCEKDVPVKNDLFHDIHISLVESPTVAKDEECQSVVVEMSPHHQPDSWNKKTMEKVPVRVTGQIFFDSSHVPCKGGHGWMITRRVLRCGNSIRSTASRFAPQGATRPGRGCRSTSGRRRRTERAAENLPIVITA
jgi:hypothetical protein